MAHGRRVLADNGGAANKQRTAKKEKKVAAALPLKFFNVKTSERFVFKRRDKKCLTLSPRSSLIPVFIHFSDFFPDLVQATLVKCRALIKECERVVILKPNQGKPQIDDVVWEGPGASLPDRCWDRQGVILRTLDIVAYKVGARDRKRELLPIEQQLWDVLGPFLARIRDFAKSLNEGALELEQYVDSVDAVYTTLQGQKPWSVRISAVLTNSAPAVGDREHILYYSPQNGVFTREFVDQPDDEDKDCGIPLVTVPCRLQSVLPTHPSVPQVLRYLVSVVDRLVSQELRVLFRALADTHPVIPEAPKVCGKEEMQQQAQQQQQQQRQQQEQQQQQPPPPSQPHPDDMPGTSGGCGSGRTNSTNIFDIGMVGLAVQSVVCGNKRGAVGKTDGTAKGHKRLKSNFVSSDSHQHTDKP